MTHFNSFCSGTVKLFFCASIETVFVDSQAKVIIQAAYGSPRHLGIYTELGLLSDQIYILSKRTSRKEYDNCQVTCELCALCV